jgi:hypothetical protein
METMKAAEKETLLQKISAFQARVAAIEAGEKEKRRKEDTRLKILLGAAVLADSQKHPETRGAVQTVVQRAFASGGERDKEFLKSKGWL